MKEAGLTRFLLLVVVISVPLFFDIHSKHSPFDFSKLLLLDGLVFVMLAIWAMPVLYFKANINIAIIYMLLSGIVSMCLSLDFTVSLFGCFKRFDGFLSFVVYVCLFYLVVVAIKRADFDLFFKTIIATCAVSCLYGIFQYFDLDIYRWSTDFGHRPGSTIGHPSILAGYIVMILPFVYYYNIKRALWSYPVVLLFLFALIITQTKGAFIAMFVSGLYFCVLIRIKTRVMCLFVAVIILCGLLMPVSPVKRIYNDLLSGGLKGSTLNHYQMAFVGIDIIKDYPVFGIGQDCLGMVYSEYYKDRYNVNKEFELQNRLHNEFLDIIVDTGFVGLLAWLFFLFCYFRIVWRERNDPLMIAVSSGVVAYLIQNQFIFGHIPTLTMFWVMVGMTVVISKEESLIWKRQGYA